MPMNPSVARLVGETPSPTDHFDLGSPIKEPLAQVQIVLQPLKKYNNEGSGVVELKS